MEGSIPLYISSGMENPLVYRGAELLDQTSRKNKRYIIDQKRIEVSKIKEKENMEKEKCRIENDETRAKKWRERDEEGELTELQLGTRKSYIKTVVEQVVSDQREEQKRRREYRRRRKEVEKWRRGEGEGEGESCRSEEKV